MKRKVTLLLCALALFLFNSVYAQVSVTTAGSPVTEDFTGFTGSGFVSPPGPGQLSSSDWDLSGFSDAYTYGGSNISGDYARGVRNIPASDVFSGGIYGLNDTLTGNNAMWIQPTGGDFTPGSATLYLVNNTGSTITSLNVAYDILVLNNQARSNSFNFSYSTDNSTYTDVPALDFASPGTADDMLSSTPRSGVITPLNIPNGGSFYLRWSGGDVSGAGSRDEFGLDNISIIANTGTPNQLLSFETTSASVSEDTVSFMVEVSVDITSGSATSVDVVVDTSGSAGSPGDFTISPSTLVFPAGSTASQFVTISIVNDMVPESIESAIINLENPTNNANILNGTHTTTIFDDDNIFVSLADDASALEAAAGSVTVNVTIDNPLMLSGTSVDVVLDTNSTATNGVDFNFTPSTINFTNAATETAMVSITVSDDGDFEADETVILNLVNANNGAIIAGGSYTFTILNDDAAPSGPCSDLFFSEYIEGSSNNKAVELYNPTDNSIDLSEYSILRYNNGSTSVGGSQTLSGSLSAGDVLVIANSSADSVVLAQADITTGTITFYNGNDALELYHFGELIDVIGNVGQDSLWVVDTGSTKEFTLVRRQEVQEGNTNWTASAASEWIAYPQNTFSFLGAHTADPCGPVCTPPTGLVSNVTGTRTVTLSYNAVPGALGYEISGGVSGSNPANYVVIERIGENNTSFAVINLCVNFNYEWRVRTICSNDGVNNVYSDYSPTVQFTTNACAAPASANSLNVTNSSVTLSWTAVPGALGYRISGQAQGGPIVVINVSGGASNSFQVNNLPSGTNFVWQVQAICALNTLCVGSISGANISPAIASAFATLPAASEKTSDAAGHFPASVKVFPNPSYGNMTIQFSNPDGAPYSFVMSDVSGRVVKVMENITNNTFEVSRSNLNSGIYFFELRGSKDTQTGKMILK